MRVELKEPSTAAWERRDNESTRSEISGAHFDRETRNLLERSVLNGMLGVQGDEQI